MSRTLYAKTDYGIIKIVNLKRVWITNFLGIWRLMYQDDKCEINCIYQTRNSKDRLIQLKVKLMQAYKNDDTFIELYH